MGGKVAMGVGHAPATAGAGTRAARDALDALGGASAQGAALFLPYRGANHRAITREVAEALGPDVALVGGTTYGEIAGGRPVEGEVVVTVFGGDGVRAGASLGRGLGASPRGVASTAVGDALAMLGDATPRMLFVVYDPLAADMRGVMEGLQQDLDPGFPIVGAGSGTGDLAETRPLSLQLAGGSVLGGSIAVLALGGDLDATVIGATGCQTLGGPFEVTGVRGTTLTALDGRPAREVFLSALGRSEQASRESGEGEEQVVQVLRVTPRGAPAGSHSMLALYATDAADGALTLAVELSLGDQVEVVATDRRSFQANMQTSLSAGLARLAAPPVGALVSDCYGWKVMLRSAVGEELVPLSRALGSAALAGMYSGGEIGNVGGAGAPVHWFSNFLVSAALIAPR